MKLAAAAVALAIAAGTATALYRLDPVGPENEFQTVSYAGANPFTAPVGTDVPGMVPVAAGGEQPADTPQMYAADPAAPACDGAALLGQLQADPAKAAAWAEVQRIGPDQLPAYTRSLSPVVLRSPTAVVDHGYRDGTFVATPAVLAAGTAVFVNSYGQPTVKCFSGNPLAPGESSDPAVTMVAPAAAPIATHTFHHPRTGRPITRPGRPDTTGSGPTPIPTDIGGGIGGGTTGGDTGGTPGPVTPPPLTGTFNDDGSITLSDGRIQLPTGAIITLPTPPNGSTPLPDGGYRNPDGTIVNRDGTKRAVLDVEGPDRTLIIVLPDGTVRTREGPRNPLPPGLVVKRSYDGSITLITPDPRGGYDTIQVISNTGRPGPVLTGRYENGAVIDVSGRLLNPDGTERRETTIPGGGKVQPNGTNVPAPSTGTGGTDRPSSGPDAPTEGGGSGTRTPTTDAPRIDQPFEPRSPRTGVLETDTGGDTDPGSGTGETGDGSGH